MSYLIVGASSGLGRELAYSFARNKKNLYLISRDERDLKSIKSDLEKKYKIIVNILTFDFSKIEEIQKNLIEKVVPDQDIEGILFPIGLMFEKDTVNLETDEIKKIFNANCLSIIYLISKVVKIISQKNFLVVGFGSVSGLLGRNLNSNYAAAKRALESFFESLAFENINTNLKVQFYTLGYLNTNLAFGKKLIFPKGSINKLAKLVYKNRNMKMVKTFFPYYWSVVALILKLVPVKFLINFKKLF